MLCVLHIKVKNKFCQRKDYYKFYNPGAENFIIDASSFTMAMERIHK